MAIFASRMRSLVVILVPTETVLDELRRPMTIKGKKATFANGRYKTDDPKEIEMLRNHAQFNIEFFEVTDEAKRIKEFHETKVIHGALGAGPKVEGDIAPPAIPSLKEEILAAVDVKITNVMGQILSAIEGMPKPAADEPVKPKKIFTCPICKEPFPSGIAVGKHKKEAHPEVS